jgi:hypothetical protein
LGLRGKACAEETRHRHGQDAYVHERSPRS